VSQGGLMLAISSSEQVLASDGRVIDARAKMGPAWGRTRKS